MVVSRHREILPFRGLECGRRMTNKRNMIMRLVNYKIPGQCCVLHGAFSSSFPEQFLPPCAGAGLLHCLRLEINPPPHSLLQLP